jgi:K+-sensing histidine kinase KdpD
MSSTIPARLYPVAAIAGVAGLCFASVRLFAGSAISHILPLLFTVVLFALSRRYGMAVAVVGSPLCAFIFAHWLFAPTGSWHVDSFAARQSLLWMVVGTIALSYLFAPPGSQKQS